MSNNEFQKTIALFSKKHLLCDSCFNYSTHLAKLSDRNNYQDFIRCTNKKCTGKRFAPDPLLLLPILLLNRKGFKTIMSCEGHLGTDNMWIDFENEHPELIPYLKNYDGFEYEFNYQYKKQIKDEKLKEFVIPKSKIYYNFENYNEVKKQKEILEVNSRFLDFVDSLPLQKALI